MHMTHNGNYRVRCLQFLGRRSVPYPEVPQKSSTISLNGNLKVRRGQSAERRAKGAISQNTLNEGAFLSSTACWQMTTACCKLSAASYISLCSMPYALCSMPSTIRIPQSHLGLAWFLHFEKTTKIAHQFSNKIKTYYL